MKIYIYTTHYPNIFKPYYDTHFAELLESGHDVRVFSLGNISKELSRKYRESGLQQRTSTYNPDTLRGVSPFFGEMAGLVMRRPRESLRLWSTLAEHDDSLKERIKSFVRASALPDAPPDFNLVHGHDAMRLFEWLPHLYPGRPVALFYYGGQPPEVGRIGKDAMRRVWRAADVVFVPSRYAASEVARRGCTPEKVEVLPLAFDVDSFVLPDDRDYRPGGMLRLISVGRLSRGKGYQYVLRALSQLREERPSLDVQYQIVGEGPRRQEVEAMVDELALSNWVELVGSLPFEKVRELYACSDALVLSSFSTESWTETQGTVIQEAMLMGNVVITTETGGVPESIPEFMELFQVEPKDAAALKEAILRVDDLGVEELERLGRAGREWVHENYRIEDCNEALLSTVAEKTSLSRDAGSRKS